MPKPLNRAAARLQAARNVTAIKLGTLRDTLTRLHTPRTLAQVEQVIKTFADEISPKPKGKPGKYVRLRIGNESRILLLRVDGGYVYVHPDEAPKQVATTIRLSKRKLQEALGPGGYGWEDVWEVFARLGYKRAAAQLKL